MTSKTTTRNPIQDLPRHVQGTILRELLDGYTQVPTVYVIDTDPLRFVYLHKWSSDQNVAPKVTDMTAVIEGIMGGPIALNDKDFDFQGEIRNLFAYDVNFWFVTP